MSDIVNAFFHRSYPPDWRTAWALRSIGGVYAREYAGDRSKTIFPEMVCADGLRLSVQGHFGAYSYPRDDFAEEYLKVEVMGPKNIDGLLAPFEQECNSVGEDRMIYPYVPVSVVTAVIEKHGGLLPATRDMEASNG